MRAFKLGNYQTVGKPAVSTTLVAKIVIAVSVVAAVAANLRVAANCCAPTTKFKTTTTITTSSSNNKAKSINSIAMANGNELLPQSTTTTETNQSNNNKTITKLTAIKELPKLGLATQSSNINKQQQQQSRNFDNHDEHHSYLAKQQQQQQQQKLLLAARSGNEMQISNSLTLDSTKTQTFKQLAQQATNSNLHDDYNMFTCEKHNQPKIPIFQLPLLICNFEEKLVDIHTITILPQLKQDQYKLCLKGPFAEKFIIDDDKIKLRNKIDQHQTELLLILIRVQKRIDPEKWEAITGIQFSLSISDCTQNELKWQTVAVAILASVCVVLFSALAIQYIQYQQKLDAKLNKTNGGNANGDDDDDDDDDARDEPPVSRANSDETFINPRRTSSYDFNTLTKASSSNIDMRNIPEEQ